MNEQVTLKITFGEATNDTGLTLSGVIETDVEVADRDDFVEPDVVEHINRNYPVNIDVEEGEK